MDLPSQTSISSPPKVSIIIPAFNEATVIGGTLDLLGRAEGDFEVLVADGESEDSTRRIVAAKIPDFPHPLRIVNCPRNRARQLNLASEHSRGSILMFLHADIAVPPDAICRLEEAIRNPDIVGGNFQIIFEGESLVSRVFTWLYRVRRPFGIYYGDSGVFVRREIFREMRGFKTIPIMDDYDFIRRLERRGKTVCIDSPLVVSDRRWRIEGLGKTLFTWIWIQTLYSIGVSAERLAGRYGPTRENRSKPEMAHEKEQEIAGREVV